MTGFKIWLSEHKFQAYLAAFFMISIPSAALYTSAQSVQWTLVFLVVIILGNLLTVFVR